jgi:N-acetylglutamate synthase-like GNAT family acetyltransferase
MTQDSYRVRRALIDDLPALRELWGAMHFQAGDLEKQLSEFQVAVSPDGGLVGAIGIQINRQHACLHSEGYADFSVADAVRELFWERIQVLTANHGVFRLWTLENSPFWTRWGFKPASGEILGRLPPEWKDSGDQWFTLQLKDEDTINAVMEKEFAAFKSMEGREVARLQEKARTLNFVFTVIGIVVGLLFIGIAVYLLIHRASQGLTR